MGVFEEAKGAAKDKIGEVTDDRQLEAEGEAQQERGEHERKAETARAEAQEHEKKADALSTQIENA